MQGKSPPPQKMFYHIFVNKATKNAYAQQAMTEVAKLALVQTIIQMERACTLAN